MENSIREDIKILEALKDKKVNISSSFYISGIYELNEDEKDAIEHIISECKILRDKFVLISETCIDVSKRHIEESEGIKQIVEILGR